MGNDNPSDTKHLVEVELNQQQRVILEKLKASGEYGTDDAEIIRNVFRDFLQRTRI